MKYVIQYTFDWVQLGCDCCTDWETEIHVFEEHRVAEGVYTHYASNIDSLYDEEELRAWVNDEIPEFNNFELHEDTRFA